MHKQKNSKRIDFFNEHLCLYESKNPYKYMKAKLEE